MQTWATADQLRFLRSMRPAFRKHQAEGTTAFFWSEMYAAWLEHFPDETYDGGKPWLKVCISSVAEQTQPHVFFSGFRHGTIITVKAPTGTTNSRLLLPSLAVRAW